MGVMTHRLKTTAVEHGRCLTAVPSGKAPQRRCSGDGSVLQRACTFRELCGVEYEGLVLG